MGRNQIYSPTVLHRTPSSSVSKNVPVSTDEDKFINSTGVSWKTQVNSERQHFQEGGWTRFEAGEPRPPDSIASQSRGSFSDLQDLVYESTCCTVNCKSITFWFYFGMCSQYLWNNPLPLIAHIRICQLSSRRRLLHSRGFQSHVLDQTSRST
jgi:hypothetical protein